MNKLEFMREEAGIAYWRFADAGDKLRKPPREERRTVHSLVVSDTHFGKSECRARALLATLNTFWITDNLVLNGDVFQGSDLGRASGAQEHVTDRIRKLGDPDSDTHVNDIWVRGNHDEKVLNTFSRWFGLKVYDEYLWECGGKRYLAVHGDQWDLFVSIRPRLTGIVNWFDEFAGKLDPQNRHIVRFVRKLLSRFRQEDDTIAKAAVTYGREKGVDYIFCGHTHKALRRKFSDIEYLNSGSWTQNPCSFITVSEAGPVLNFVELS